MLSSAGNLTMAFSPSVHAIERHGNRIFAGRSDVGKLRVARFDLVDHDDSPSQLSPVRQILAKHLPQILSQEEDQWNTSHDGLSSEGLADPLGQLAHRRTGMSIPLDADTAARTSPKRQTNEPVDVRFRTRGPQHAQQAASR